MRPHKHSYCVLQKSQGKLTNMKIQRSVIGRFLQLARKMWKSNQEGDSQIVVFTVTQRACSIAMARDALLLTYLCDRVASEASEQVIAVQFEPLQDCSDGAGVVDLQSIVENGESCIAVKWSDELGRCERMYPAQDPPKYHLLPDLAWHTVDERMVRTLRGAATEPNVGEMAANRPCVNSRPIEPVVTVPR